MDGLQDPMLRYTDTVADKPLAFPNVLRDEPNLSGESKVQAQVIEWN